MTNNPEQNSLSQPVRPSQNSTLSPLGGLPWFVACSAALLAFTAITWLMLTNEELRSLDLEWARDFQDHAESHQGWREFFSEFTHLGGRACLAIVAALGVVGAVLVRKEYLLAGIWVLATAGGALVNVGVKSVIERQRPGPELRDPALQVRHDSYPSGHAMGSIIGYGMYLYAGFLWYRRWGVRTALVVGFVALVGLIGFSRIYLRAHWFSDVLGGYALGAAWLWLCLAIHRWLMVGLRSRSGLPA